MEFDLGQDATLSSVGHTSYTNRLRLRDENPQSARVRARVCCSVQLSSEFSCFPYDRGQEKHLIWATVSMADWLGQEHREKATLVLREIERWLLRNGWCCTHTHADCLMGWCGNPVPTHGPAWPANPCMLSAIATVSSAER